MAWPDFLIIGAAKAGTTALHYQLAKHPQCFMSRHKEPSFFAFEENEVLSETRPGGQYGGVITRVNDYQALFKDAPADATKGEVSPAYLYFPNAAEAIAQRLPQVKLVTVLRNPVDRAWSAYIHIRRIRHETHLDFREALVAESERISAGWNPLWYYTKVGFYHEQLQRYYQHFPREQVFVEDYEVFQQQPKVFYDRLLSFLEVDNQWESDKRRYNVGKISTESPLRTRLRRTVVGSLYRKLLPNQIRKKIQPAMVTPEPMDAELRAELTNVFRDDILRLEDLLQRDFSHWL